MGRNSQASERAGRLVMRPPGRPPVGRREHRQRFWAAIARGLSSEDAAAEAGVSGPVGVRWFREGGGMAPVLQAPLSGRYLSPPSAGGDTILRARGREVCEIASHLGWVAQRSRAYCSATPEPAAACSSTPRPRSGTLTGAHRARWR